MATKNIESGNMGITDLVCDICSSTDIIETTDGYVCRTCGVVLEVQKLEYHRPYNEDIIQYAQLGTTQIGFKHERLRNKNSYRLENLNKLHSIKENEEVVEDQAKIEISRLLSCLNKPNSYKTAIFEKFKKIRAKLAPGTKYRGAEKLVPIVLYFTLKFKNISVNENELLEYSKISKKDFNAFKLQIHNFIPHYALRNRQEYVMQKILEITEMNNLDMAFCYLAKKIMYKLWKGIQATKDDVIAGLVASLALLCTGPLEGPSINSICQTLGIKMSTIQSQVKNRIIERFNVPGFTSLIRSADLIKKVIEKLGLFELDTVVESREEIEEISVEVPEEELPLKESDIIEIKVGSGIDLFNSKDIFDYYFFMLRDREDNPMCVSFRISRDRERYKKSRGSEQINEPARDTLLFDATIMHYNSCNATPS